ncbi:MULTISPECIES: HPP family protein [Xanthobacter]|uniref:HPP family protein n=1 Tax=Xanthobacter TaxID=279 RepID=UPI0035B0DE50
MTFLFSGSGASGQGAPLARRALEAGLAGFGAFLAILLLGLAQDGSGVLLLIAPFGASCVLVFALPQSPLARPRNVVGGHVLSTAVGVVVLSFCGAAPWAVAMGVGVAIAVMLLTDTLHPPAGADPIVAMLMGASWTFALMPVAVGAMAIVLLATGFHRYVTRRPYPIR